MEPRELMLATKKLIDQHRYNQIQPMIVNYPRGKELVHIIDHQGKNIVFRAIQIKEDDICLKALQYLVHLGCDIKQRDNNKQTILYFAARDERQSIVKYLLPFNFPKNQADFFNQTPLFYAAKYNKGDKICEMLLKAGIDVNQKDNNGQTCIFYSADTGNLQICKLFVQYGVNPNLIDKNRQKPSTYARKKGFLHILDYINNYKKDNVVRIKQEKGRVNQQESSQNTLEQKKKKQIMRSQYALIYTDQNGNSKVLTEKQLLLFQNASEQNLKLFKLMSEPNEIVQGFGPLPDKKFQRIATRILLHFSRLDNGYHFLEPVNYTALGLLDYPTIIKYPMDFGTIKRKLNLNAYENEFQFQQDMNLIFDNCILYNGSQKDIGRIALQMKMEFNTLYGKEFSG